MSNQPRDWDKELAAIDKVMAKGGAAPASAPVARGAAPVAALPGGGALTRRAALTTWVRAALGILVAAAVLQWPYAHRCGLGLMLYLGSAGMVVVAGAWTMLVSWRRRQGWAHLAGLTVFLGGLALVGAILLPRLGYTVTALPWLCE
ncbi:MAG TPA: hypothetical protein VFV65_07555 [Gemmatimonadales bacterium]|nr:hypothetical protein [Gemmatimonadales bacterium]